VGFGSVSKNLKLRAYFDYLNVTMEEVWPKITSMDILLGGGNS